MISSMWNGVIGIHNHDRALNVEANNSTNVNVYGFKPDAVNFTDLLYSADGTGKGSQIGSIHKVFNQGEIQVTGNPYDVAIEGSGYFVLEDINSGELYYSRAGNFQMGNDGLLQSPNNMKVLGLQSEAPDVLTTNPDAVEFNDQYTKFIASEFVGSNPDFYQSINVRATDYYETATDIGESGNGFKSRSDVLIDIDKLIVDYREKLSAYASNAEAESVESTKQITGFDFGVSMDLLNGENDSIKVTINNFEVRQYFDTDLETTLKKFSDKVSALDTITSTIDTDTGVMTISSMIPGKTLKITDGVINDKEVYSYTIQDPSLGSGLGMVNSSRQALQQALESAGAEFLEIKNNIPLTEQENLDNLDTIQLKLENMSLSENTFGTITIEENGLVFLADGDNKFLVGKVQTVAFRAEQELTPAGSNLFSQTRESGDPYYTEGMNKIRHNSLELSNADLSDSLSKILVLQRAFEANAKSITTSDELLRTAIELKNG